jgi:hypothetical protein
MWKSKLIYFTFKKHSAYDGKQNVAKRHDDDDDDYSIMHFDLYYIEDWEFFAFLVKKNLHHVHERVNGFQIVVKGT